jgi:hypothetical protein
MNDLASKQYIVEMLREGFVIAPCANPECEQLFSSDEVCVACEMDGYEVS